MTRKSSHVAIVGAGISGLRCADVLLDNGFNVTIFEARNRIGGRLHQDDSLGYPVDMGPNWIHDHGPHNPLSRLAAKTGTLVHKWGDTANGMTVTSDGRVLAADEAIRDTEAGWAYIRQAVEHSDEHFTSIDPKRSVRAYLEEVVRKDHPDPEKISAIVRVAEHMGAYPGDDVSELSLKYFYTEDTEGGEDVFVASTYRAIFEDIAKMPLAKAEIRFEAEVDLVHSGEDSVRIRCKSGSESTFDAVVVSCPLGWLKNNMQAFEPPLPLRICSALDDLSFGRLEKCYITFKEAWWLTDSAQTGPNGVHLGVQYPEITSFHSTASSGPVECLALSSLPPSTSHPTLLFYLFGDFGATMVNQISVHAPHGDKYNSALASFFSPFYSKLPHYDPNAARCVPVAFLATTWGADPLAGFGSYTNFQVGLEDAKGDLEVMKEGMPKRRVWFAGEHAAGIDHFATATAAYRSGQEIAGKVCLHFDTGLSSEDR